MKNIFLILFTFSASILFAQPNKQTIVCRMDSKFDIGFGFSSSLSKDLLLVVNGPLVNREGIPVGGYIDNGVVKKKWVNPENFSGNFSVGNGIFGIYKNGEPFMVSYKNRKEINKSNIKWAFQNGLMLVKDGINIRGTSVSKKIRSGIGYNRKGKLIIIISFEEITLSNFAELFLDEDCFNAIYLDGGPYVYLDNGIISGGIDQKKMKLQFFN